VALQPVRDLCQLMLERRSRPVRQVRQLAEPEPTVQAVRVQDVEVRLLGRDLARELRRVPVVAPDPDQVDARSRDAREPVRRRAVRETDREDGRRYGSTTLPLK
jgi:hypothetical protein